MRLFKRFSLTFIALVISFGWPISRSKANTISSRTNFVRKMAKSRSFNSNFLAKKHFAVDPGQLRMDWANWPNWNNWANWANWNNWNNWRNWNNWGNWGNF